MNEKQITDLIERMRELGHVYSYQGAKILIREYEKLNKPEKVKIPQFVAEIIEYYKGQNATLYDALREKNFNKQYSEWLLNEQNAYNKVARAWLDGYEVEQEKRYEVSIKASGQYLARNKLKEIQFMYNGACSHFTRKELEEAEFGWVFDCPGIEIEEVEE
ncbi:TPA: DUF1642 domain-containing protein [Streptococcus pyogenes]|nr:DUF1642 domain-containing protein [Streptococcus pyogenes]HEQ1577537.1 DUF1642 domain-containing protein [Streptococcus pyogenes]